MWLFFTSSLASPLPVDLPGSVMPDRHWDVVHLDLDLTVDLDTKRVSGVATHQIEPLGRTHGWVRLHQVDLDIEEVRVDGEPVSGWRLGRQTLDVPVSPGPHELRVRYSAEPHTGLHWRTSKAYAAREVWSQGQREDNRYWYPGWDYPNDRFTVSTHLTVDRELHALAVGTLSEKQALEDGRTRWSYRLDEPVANYLVAVAIGEYDVYHEPSAPVPLELVVPSGTPEAIARHSLGRAAEQLTWFAELFGAPFPFGVYRQVAVQDHLYGGMENPTLTVLEAGWLAADPLYDHLADRVTAHEAVHQWFGDSLTGYGWRELWLNEGFATYYDGRWQGHTQGSEAFAARVAEWRTAFGSKPMASRGWSHPGGSGSSAVYGRGAMVLHMLRVALGDDVFDSAIRSYVAENSGRFVESEDLRRALEDTSGMHLGWLFDQWVFTGGQPEVETSSSFEQGVLTVTLAQTTEGTPYAAPVDIEIGVPSDVLTRRVWLGAGETRLVLDLAAPPQWVAVDPRGGVLAEWKHTQEPEAWLAQLQHSPTPLARLTAMHALGEQKTRPEVVTALAAELRSDKSRLYRLRAAEALGELRSEDATETLVSALDDLDPYVRQAVVTALGAGTGHPTLLRRLTRLAHRDSNPAVRGEAVKAVLSLDESLGLDLARDRLKTRDTEELVAIASALGESGEEPEARALLLLLRPSVDPRVVRAAARAIGQIVPREELPSRHPLRDKAVDALLPRLKDESLWVRQGAIQALGQIGSARAETHLRAFAAATPVLRPDLAEVARDAAFQIRHRGEADPQPEDESVDDVALDARLQAVEDRLERLEQWR